MHTPYRRVPVPKTNTHRTTHFPRHFAGENAPAADTYVVCRGEARPHVGVGVHHVDVGSCPNRNAVQWQHKYELGGDRSMLDPSTKRLDDVAPDVEILRGDLGNFSHVLDAVSKSKPGVIYHLGGVLSGATEIDPASAIRVNATGTYHVLEAARLFGVSQVLLSTTIGTYGHDLKSNTLEDQTLQRPRTVYGVTKVFGEHLGLFYRSKYDLDFRSVRYPSIVGPGVTTAKVVQYFSWAVEQFAGGNPFDIWVEPEARIPVMYNKDAARAIVELGEAPRENVRMVNYLVAGMTPVPSALELAEAVKAKVPEAVIGFRPDPEVSEAVRGLLLTLDDSNARREWGWKAEYDLERTVEDFLQELKLNPQRYG